MKKITFLLVLLLIQFTGKAQTEYKNLESEKLQETRQIKIQLPRNYETNTEKSYPIIIVLDGGYLFEPVAGNVDYYSYWEEMPEALVIGVNQKDRREDTKYDPENYLPTDKGADFFEFIGGELLPLIAKNYRTVDFTIIVGHDITANFLNYYLFKDDPIFQGYINLSPDYAPKMHERIQNALERSKKKIWYYLATGSDDIDKLKEDSKAFDESLQKLSNSEITYNFDNFEGTTHYSLVGNAIPKAIEDIFSIYRPISQIDYQEKLLKTDGTFYDYLIEKYKSIEELYDLKNKIRVNDFMAISSAIEEKEKWDDYKDLGKLADKTYPETMMGSYFLARYYEETGKPKRALRKYQVAYPLKEISYLTQDMMLNKADKLKADFGL